MEHYRGRALIELPGRDITITEEYLKNAGGN